jgi:hypothetical protein
MRSIELVRQRRLAMILRLLPRLAVWACCLTCLSWEASRGWITQAGSPVLGLFEAHSEVGNVLNPGGVEFDAARGTYLVSGSGENVWAAADAFHFVWKKVSGDVTLSADISFAGTGGNAHRKSMLMIRQDLDADSVYVDAVAHGDGLTSLQARQEKGGNTHEVQSNIKGPKRLRIEKRGDYFYILVAGEGESLRLGGGSMKLALKEPFYVGIGVCAHDAKVTEKALFSNVELITGPRAKPRKPALHSTLEVVAVSSTDCRSVWVGPGRIESPNWSKDGQYILYNSGGLMYRVPAAGGKPVVLNTGFAKDINAHHGISPDGEWLAFSDGTRSRKRSVIYVVPVAGGEPRRVTQGSPSDFGGWSPDGKTIAFTRERGNKFEIYTIPAEGGKETLVASVLGSRSSASFSPDGKYIYFGSNRSGNMQVWRMQPNGSGQEPVTSDETSKWSSHLSPDGRRLAFISAAPGTKLLSLDQDVTLRMMPVNAKQSTYLASFLGGQGSMDSQSWSPDGRSLAFVSYQLRE